MLGIFLDRIPALEERWEEYRELFTEISVPAKTTLLKAGEIPTKIFFVRQGALRISFDSKGKDVTLQFFFENEMVASFDSFMRVARPAGNHDHGIAVSPDLEPQMCAVDPGVCALRVPVALSRSTDGCERHRQDEESPGDERALKPLAIERKCGSFHVHANPFQPVMRSSIF